MAGGASQNKLIGNVTPLLKSVQGVDHAIDIDHHNPAGADQTLQKVVARGSIQSVPPQHPGHFGENHIRDESSSRLERPQKCLLG